MTAAPFLLAATLWPMALAQNSASQAPESQLPPAVVAELRRLENQFELALSQDCPPEKCFSRGCTYAAHVVADKPKTSSLPGLGDQSGPGGSGAQEYLTQARCEVASETSIPTKDVQILVKRLEQKLSKGYLVVTIEAKPLPPLPATLKQTPGAPTPPPQWTPPPLPTPVAAPTPLAPPPWDSRTLVREFWLSVLPHLPWMLGLILATLAGLIGLWAWRRLGLETAEEKALLASLEQAPAPHEEKPEAAPVVLDVAAVEKAFVAEQSMLWRAKVEKDPRMLDKVLTTWLREGEFPLLAKAVFTFEPLANVDFPAAGDLARRKLEFAEYLRQSKKEELPEDVDFYRQLNQHVLVASVLAQADAEVCARLNREFGSTGVASLAGRLPPHLGAILLTLISSHERAEVASLLPSELRRDMAASLVRSNRASREEMGAVLEAVRSTCVGAALPAFPSVPRGGLDMGQEIDAAGVLSTLLPLEEKAARQELLALAHSTHAGHVPAWLSRVFFPQMLLGIPAPQRTELLLTVDLGALASWLTTVPQSVKEALQNDMPASLRNALHAHTLGEVSAEHATEALIATLTKEYAAGRLQWSRLVVQA